MNVIKVNVNFKNRTIDKQGVDLTSGDYNSTKLVFEFDRQDGRKVFEMKDPDGNLVLLTDIVNNEVELVGKDENGNNVSLFNQPNDYTFEISLYDENSKLTSASDRIKVKQEEVIVDGEPIIAYLPIFDKLINEVENLNVEVDENILTITKKDGTKESVNIKGDAYVITDEDLDEIETNVKSNIQPILEEIENVANQAEIIARGRATGYVFQTEEDLDAWLLVEENVDKLVLGDNFYIVATDVPDYWWDGTQKRVLETEKPDLTDYAKKEQFVTLTQVEYDALTEKSANTYYFIIEEE